MKTASKLIIGAIATLAAASSSFAGFTAVSQTSTGAQLSLSPLISLTLVDVPFASWKSHTNTSLSSSFDVTGYSLSMSLQLDPGTILGRPDAGGGNGNTYSIYYNDVEISSGTVAASLSVSGSTLNLLSGTFVETQSLPGAARTAFTQESPLMQFFGTANGTGSNITVVVPEPATLGLLTLGSLALLRRRRD